MLVSRLRHAFYPRRSMRKRALTDMSDMAIERQQSEVAAVGSVAAQFELFHPGDELAAARVAIVSYQSRPMALDLSHQQLYWFRIKFGVIEKRQLAEPPEPTAPGEQPSELVRHRDAHDALTAARIEDYGVKRVKRSACSRLAHVRDRSPVAHVE